MPELPEVETVRRGLEPHLNGRVITRAEVRRPDLRWPLPPDLVQVLTGAQVTGLRRRSKYILIDLHDRGAVLLHLGMSGRMLIQGQAPGEFHRDPAILPRHDHVVLWTDAGTSITFNDARRFGMVDLLPPDSDHRLLAHLGPEPLSDDFTPARLAVALSGRRSPIKAALLDQRIVAGLGNIYVSEALFRAGIDPRRPAGQIDAAHLRNLVDQIRAVLTEAIASGGSSLRDHRQANGELGYFQHAFRVYDREGSPCPTPGCAGTIQRIVQSGRSSYFCPHCQH
ncbi:MULTISPECIES: bifunctional DNA-formamidopyrimidine glycosylase/DNA-(apurinic or apyrimidinic site) lyase [unclassified Paracoccus (in: a-proteobacteria)]|uniref:bifunctional DNA-formamidopyrimidine glycosylase/DNA-(apurinic or apyrimidinic site) lyase n=1 Tax=unclassified Paracoccus (in: a-proteobacteria) TaxID=2688777 RepID=UPI0012B1D5F6|nr:MULTISPECIES: bifunctional DNA-formamidopyrimidine glycosylase/DNA-(apurinic or apyrimidinic site) lyase [unclassified Paracoccus (in: a-proteobacteria)]UXU74916.1 bifunctional DNA-formamidopyrimidine glycosylase/DNA-(apurinic or apyrimidinic site) lyase [Paracoccus sp. SMMA_5]UXU80819.1 bifunctional DNA-formamidopyrimidine glycosylase/DNA-(apurinic or apyrimidinic site) lyase [Paracoccus sp. SMMA_5_TC]